MLNRFGQAIGSFIAFMIRLEIAGVGILALVGGIVLFIDTPFRPGHILRILLCLALTLIGILCIYYRYQDLSKAPEPVVLKAAPKNAAPSIPRNLYSLHYTYLTEKRWHSFTTIKARSEEDAKERFLSAWKKENKPEVEVDHIMLISENGKTVLEAN